jgi:hypothetical protein
MANVVHRTLTLNENHATHAFTFANAAARLAAVVVAADIGKIALQTDTETYWMLTSVTPVKWVGADGTNTGDITLTAVGAAPSANGATLAGQVLTLQPADSSNPGVMSAADKTKLDGISPGALTYDLLFGSSGAPTASQVLARAVMAKTVTLPINCTGSVGFVGVVPTAPATLTVNKNGTPEVTINITVGGVVSFVNASPVVFVFGDVVTLVGQALPDATLADIAITLIGTL